MMRIITVDGDYHTWRGVITELLSRTVAIITYGSNYDKLCTISEHDLRVSGQQLAVESLSSLMVGMATAAFDVPGVPYRYPQRMLQRNGSRDGLRVITVGFIVRVSRVAIVPIVEYVIVGALAVTVTRKSGRERFGISSRIEKFFDLRVEADETVVRELAQQQLNTEA
ncbi:hypothetical protein BDP27DRAFT_1370751 [Rhodocollybia butyracea]|uniref:Uncharacterized protein n=1 Tax=Rhodocollybia butyracea TaxID=206335 RepID=A0A9P5PDQ0_9AGAR|nr:hypothetical protein BDP27DRAFT_1370751 [Rhodocollybia butyracea]